MSTPKQTDRMSASTLVLVVGLLVLPALVWILAVQTSARFGALVPVGRARLIVGTVDIDLEVADTSDLLVNATNMAPGDSVFGGITTSNVGSLDVRYRVDASILGDSPDEWVAVETWVPAAGSSAEACLEGNDAAGSQTSATPTGPLTSISPDRLLFLPAGRSAVTCLLVRLDRSTPNEAQLRSFEVAFVVDAIQAVDDPEGLSR